MRRTPPADTLNRTPFYQFHVEHGARMVEFAGWEMPILYHSIIEEHRQVRSSGGLFDVSHMGRVRFSGPDSQRLLDRLCTRQILGAADGQCRYTLLCNERGGCRDDALVYRLAADEYLMVCNAANRLKLLDHFESNRGDLEAEISDETFSTAMLAIQGPMAMDFVVKLAPEASGLKRYRFTRRDVLGAELLISRTGYTGEDGVEVILPAALAGQAAGILGGPLGAADSPIEPAGLGARDTLRMEAAMPLYGHEITEDIDPLSAGLHFAVELDKEDGAGPFIGRDALKRVAEEGPAHRLAGLRLEGRRTARQAMKVRSGRREVGFVTSACLSPTLEVPIALAYLEPEFAEPGRDVAVDSGTATIRATVAELPFYARES